MEFELNEEQQQIKRTIRESAESELRPHVLEWDEAAHFPIDLRPKFAELGILGVLFPEEYGGAGMGYNPFPLRRTLRETALRESRVRRTWVLDQSGNERLRPIRGHGASAHFLQTRELFS